MLACSPSAMARPAASSAPEFKREPDDSCKRVFCSDACVMDSWFCAARDETLFKMLSDISKLLCLEFSPGTEPCGLTECPYHRFGCYGGAICCAAVYRHCLFTASMRLRC